MSGFLANLPLGPNRIEVARLERLSSGRPLIDLTNASFTKAGFFFPENVLISAAIDYFKGRDYKPVSKGLLSAREVISSYYRSREPALHIPPEQVIITSSTSESYALLFSLLAAPGEEFLSPAVSYPLFDLLAEHARVKLVGYELSEDGGWMIAERSLRESVTSLTRGLIIVSPNNPTGVVHCERNEAICAQNLPLVVDEVFASFSIGNIGTPGNMTIPPLGTLYPELPVFHLNGISKMFALPDMKLGWIALNDVAYKRFGERLEILNDTFLGANYLTQSMLPAIFAEGLKFTSSMQESVRERVIFARGELSKSEHIHCPLPQAGTALFPRINIDRDEEELILELIDNGVLCHPGYFFGASGVHLMISVLASKDELSEGIAAIRRVIANS